LKDELGNNWRIGVLAEVVAAIGVIVSLLFVAFQLRSNTHTLRSSAYQALHDTEDGIFSDASSNPTIARIWKQAAGGVANIPEEDQPQWEQMAIRWIYLYQMVHYQHRKGMVDDEFWEAWDQGWTQSICTNVGIREFYELNKSICTEPFRIYTESCKTQFEGERASQYVSGQTPTGMPQQNDP